MKQPTEGKGIKEKCSVCGGFGYTAEHDLPSRHGKDGECISCPIQVQCEYCEGTGEIEVTPDLTINHSTNR